MSDPNRTVPVQIDQLRQMEPRPRRERWSGWQVPVQIDQLRQMERQLAEHARRAALVAEWAEGLRAGKRYTAYVDQVNWTAYHSAALDDAYVLRPETYPALAYTPSAELTARMMAAISEEWTVVE